MSKMRFKKGVQLTDEITVTMPAGEWVAFMNWINSHDTDGINYILYEMMVDQLWPALYEAADVKAAQAQDADQPKTVEEWVQRQFPNAGIFPLNVEHEEVETRIQKIPGLDRITVVCDTCGSRDEYTGLPFGPLTCGHNGPRHGIAEG